MGTSPAQAPRDLTLVALGACVLLVVGIPVTVLGLLVLLLDGVTWPILAGCATLVAGVALGTVSYRRHRAVREYRSKPRHRNRVFISYRTAEHSADAERVARVLSEAGVGVFFAGRGDLDVTQEGLSGAARELGLFKMADLDADLHGELAACDAVVYFVPTTERRLGVKQYLKDQLDALGAGLLFETGRSRAFWRSVFDKGVHGRGFSPAPRLLDLQGWQEWELSMARELQMVVVKVRLEQNGAVDNDRSDEELVTYRRETLERDITDRILPRVREAVRADLQPAGLFPMLGATAVALVGAIAMVILTVVSVLTYLIIRAVL